MRISRITLVKCLMLSALTTMAQATMSQQVCSLDADSLEVKTIDLADGNAIYLHGSDKPFGTFTLAAINAGAGNYLAEDGTQYRSINVEGFVEGGRTSPARGANMEISNTEDDQLYQTQRWGNFSYFIPARQGYYDIILKMSENHFIEPTDIGKRVFSIEVEGETVVSDLDLVAEVGPLTAYDVTVKNVLVTDFGIDIRATSSVNFAAISAIFVQGRNLESESPQP